MTEAEWLTGSSSIRLLDHLQETGKAGERKLRLCAVACCRRVERWLLGGIQKKALLALERHADGVATPDDYSVIRRAGSTRTRPEGHLDFDALEAAHHATAALVEALRIDRRLGIWGAHQQPLFETIRSVVEAVGTRHTC